jgi:transposase-like protein
MSSSSKPEPNWAAIEEDYRAGQMSVRGVAEKHDVSESTLRSRAKASQWARDLTNQVAAATRAKISRTTSRSSDAPEEVREDDDIVEAKANDGASLVFGHIASLDRWQKLVDVLAEGLVGMKVNEETHADYARSLNTGLDAQLKIIRAQRQAFNIDEDSHQESYEDRLARLMKGEG